MHLYMSLHEFILIYFDIFFVLWQLKAAITNHNGLWNTRVVPYQFDPLFSKFLNFFVFDVRVNNVIYLKNKKTISNKINQ